MRPVPNESRIPVGQVLVGKYRVTREIGRGGMAAVYEAEHLALGKKVAVKVLASELSASTIVIERFFREARAAASIKSPFIVDIYDSGRLEDGRPFICMEMLDGESLYDRMARIRIIDVETTLRVITHCAKALSKAHAAGIVHRDLKPENIFLTRNEDGDETTKLLDFGLAKFYAPVDSPDQKSARLTREGAVFGTPAYMSPEQVKGQGSVDHRADLWALGCMAFECLIGRPVWNTDQGVAMTFAAIATHPLPVPSQIRPDLPKAFDNWFFHALERDPDKRFQTAKELAAALVEAFGRGSNPEIDNTLDLPRPPSPAPSGDAFPLVRSSPNGLPVPPAPPSSPSGRLPSPMASERSLAGGEPSQRGPSMVAAPARPSPLRWAMSSVLLIVTSLSAYVVWSNYLRPQLFAPTVMSSATVAPSSAPSSSAAVQTKPDEPKWLSAIGEGQKLFADGDAAAALKKMQDASQMGGAALARIFADQIRIGMASGGACKMAAFAHPRVGQTHNVGRPSIAISRSGALVVWTDDHEQAGRDHVYSVVIDEAGRNTSSPRDLTPEANEVVRASLLAVGDRDALLFWDRAGREPGVRVRWIDADGRIGSGSTLVGAGRPGNFWPTIEKSPDGFLVAWQDDRDRDGDDIFLRKLGPELEPLGSELRATDYVAIGGKPAHARSPSLAIAASNVFLGYTLERGPTRLVYRMRVPLTGPELGKGLTERAGKPVDRELGDVALVNEDKTPGDAPSLACGAEGCFVAWHADKGGAFAALLEPAKGKVMWRKKFSEKGGRPSLSASKDGLVTVTFYEGGRVKMAVLTRDGVSASSTIAKVNGDQPRPWVAPGKGKGEFYLAWQDSEANHAEPYAARVVCRP
ncbi:MAG: serine/threonine-protein kinase [Polyangiaceae bacterium]